MKKFPIIPVAAFVLCAIIAIWISSYRGPEPSTEGVPPMCSQGEIFVTAKGYAFKCVRRHTWRPM